MAMQNNVKRGEFLKKLQLEYLTYKLRSQIYTNEKFAGVARDIAEKKRAKILKVSKDFGMGTMFDTGVQEWVQEFFWNSHGLPNLQYKDEEQHRVQGNYDAWYLLQRGMTVLYQGVEMVVVANDPSNSVVRVARTGMKTWLKYEEISLINNYQWD